MANYINKVTLKESKFSIKFSGKTEEFIEQIKAITNEKGYFNLEIQKRKEPGKYGDTHYLKVDEWKPKEGSDTLPTFAQQRDQDLPF
jgi:hypothetical protein